MLTPCFRSGVISHWNLDGLKPYMRYSLAGGYHNNGENWFGQQRWAASADTNIEPDIEDAMNWLMNSPGHRDTILDPWYRKVSLGLSYDSRSFVAIQHFEGSYIMEFEELPKISNGIFSMTGVARREITFGNPDDMSVDLWYDPPPRKLTIGQLLRREWV